MKKNLIVYGTTSKYGNTVIIAEHLAKCFEKHGWDNDVKKIPKDYDVKNPDFSFQDYDFACVGSPVIGEVPLPQVRALAYGKPEDKKLIPGPKCGIVFCTYGGIHTGPEEAAPALKMLESELMHQKFEVIGAISIPGKMKDEPTPAWYHADLYKRPNENDLKRVEFFVDDVMEKLRDRPYYL